MSQPNAGIQNQYSHGPINILKQMWFYIAFSILITIPGLVVMGLSMKEYPNHAPLRLGIDFTGGTMLQYGFETALTQDDVPKIRAILEQLGFGSPVVQLQQAEMGAQGLTNTVSTELVPDQTTVEPSRVPKGSIRDMFKAAAEEKAQAQGPQTMALKSIVSIRTKDLTSEQTIALQKSLKETFGSLSLLQKNRVGPTLAKELFVKAAWALALAYTLIVGYLTFRFKLDYALMAIVALIHDTLFMLGAFSIMGWFFHVEVDSMFMTAILTVVGFSVHDTIVVFDRIRENARVLYTKKLPFGDIVNISVNQTLARSINTSLTALLTLLALYFFGGESTQTFVLAMILGIVVGTYSSIFVASSLLAWWRTRKESINPATPATPRSSVAV